MGPKGNTHRVIPSARVREPLISVNLHGQFGNLDALQMAPIYGAVFFRLQPRFISLLCLNIT
jgi:hypothetical protein